MKRLFLLLLLAVSATALCAQTPENIPEDLRSDISKAGGVHCMYPQEAYQPAGAPKGYKPFYISHLGRHGARFALGATVYADLAGIWQKGHDKGWLTPEGEAIFQAYAALYPHLERREGNLTHKGQDQHRFIAAQMYRNFPRVFKGETRASAASTAVHRCIVSMYAFLGELDNLDRDFVYDSDYGYPYQGYLLPDVIDRPNNWPEPVQRKFEDFRDERLDLGGMLSRWFTRPDSLVASPYKFCNDLHTVVSTLDNLDVPAPAVLRGIFTPEERYRLWQVSNYRSYLRLGMAPDVKNERPEAMKALWKDFIEKARADWSKGIALRLRFAHDSTLLPLLSLLDVNGMGARISEPSEVEKHWRTYDIPMAANLQLVFFRSARNPEILVQVLLNGREAVLPIKMAAPGSFYRWSDLEKLTF